MLSAFINLVKTFVMYVAHCLTIKSARKKFERDFDRSNNYFYVTVKPGILAHSELSSLEQLGKLVKYSIRFNHVEGYLAALPNTRTVSIMSVNLYAGAGYGDIVRQLKMKCLEDLQAQGYKASIT
tara:strand:- start:722 stop:1096 length:375 start_codon:yes stop_codon:yes gene_type:complete